MLVNHPCPPSCMRLNSKRWGAPGPPIPVSWLSLCRRFKWFFLMGLISAHCRVEDCNKLLLEDCKVHCRGVLKKCTSSNRWSSLAPGGCGSPAFLALLAGSWEVPTTEKLNCQSHWWCATRSGPLPKLQGKRTSDRCPHESGHSPMLGEWPPSLGQRRQVH